MTLSGYRNQDISSKWPNRDIIRIILMLYGAESDYCYDTPAISSITGSIAMILILYHIGASRYVIGITAMLFVQISYNLAMILMLYDSGILI